MRTIPGDLHDPTRSLPVIEGDDTYDAQKTVRG